MNLQILSDKYLPQYLDKLGVDLNKKFSNLVKKEITVENFEFYFANSAVYSSNIEGNSIELDTFLKYKKYKVHKQTKEIKEIEDLIKSYEWARQSPINQSNLLKTHRISTKSFLITSNSGKYRNQRVGIFSKDNSLVYLAVEEEYVKTEMDKLLSDIKILSKSILSIEEVFYYAAYIHLVFAKIHPFMDGNGRTARLLEKWFLASKLGPSAWYIESEKNYFIKRASYYKNIHLGANYYTVNYDKCLDFLLMLPKFF